MVRTDEVSVMCGSLELAHDPRKRSIHGARAASSPSFFAGFRSTFFGAFSASATTINLCRTVGTSRYIPYVQRTPAIISVASSETTSSPIHRKKDASDKGQHFQNMASGPLDKRLLHHWASWGATRIHEYHRILLQSPATANDET